GGISAMEYTGQGNSFIALPDRGPDDGAVAYHCRFHTVEIEVDPATSTVTPKLTKTTFLTNEMGHRFPGAAIAYSATDSFGSRLDPEGVRLSANGNMFLSDEYGPHLFEFSLDGKQVREFEIPQRYLIKTPGVTKADENGANSWGRSCNRGMEGLALSPNGKFLYGIMQSPLLQDSARDELGKPYGLNCRILKVDVATGDNSEYLYKLDDQNNKLNEIMAINDHEFLVIERDGLPGEGAQFKKIMKIDLTEASEIQHLNKLPATKLPQKIRPVKKEVYIDMLAPCFGLAGANMPEKLESLTFGQTLSDGSRTLFVVSDNDFAADATTKFYVFKIGCAPRLSK
ncbi:MAG: esterase-like activity of phytase family protein, partial [Planctomicrobium sp.]|nr:esterase-like activity of phytase family protein [Planctomicrobium sp.]